MSMKSRVSRIVSSCFTYLRHIHAASIAPSPSPFCCRSSQRWSCLESRLRQRHTQRHHKASDGSSAVSAQRGSKIGVQQSQIHTHLTTSARPALATRCWTHKVPPGRSGVLLPQPDSIWWSEYLARELQWAVEVESRRWLRSASSQRLQSYAEHDSEQLATVSLVLPRLVYGLPVDVVASQSLATFKGRLKHFRSNSRLTSDAHGLCAACPCIHLAYGRLNIVILTNLTN